MQLSLSLLVQTREEGLLATKSHDWLIRTLMSITARPCEVSPAFVTPLHAQHVTVLSWKVSALYQHHGSLSLKSRSYFPAQGTQFFFTHRNAAEAHMAITQGAPLQGT